MKEQAIKLIRRFWPAGYGLVGSFIISAGWNWYHTAHRPHWRIILITLGVWVVVYAGFRGFKWLYAYFTRRFRRHEFWQKNFYVVLDQLYFIFSLIFLVFFSRDEIVSALYAPVIFLIFYWRLDRYLKKHPDGGMWRRVARAFFLFGFFIFLLMDVLQYFAFRLYILDPNAKIFNIVFFRAWAMAIFWLATFAVCAIWYRFTRKWHRYAPLGFWALCFVVYAALWALNVGVLYYSGLYLNPALLEHAEGGAGAGYLSTGVSYLLFALLAVMLGLFTVLFKKIMKAHGNSATRHWNYYHFALIALALFTFLAVASFKTTPEYLIIRSFYKYFRGETEKIELNQAVKTKLERFGLKYNTDQFYVAHKDTVYRSNPPLLAPKFSTKKPNLVIVFLESFSSRLTGVYNPKYKELTPGLNKMAADKNTTVFKNYYNASTPSITGIISLLCSYLTPFGHNEIQNENRLQRTGLMCLPRALKKNGYKDFLYMTAVSEEFANKGSIAKSMGIEKMLGQEELKKYIKAPPLAWGYSDHQMFPLFFDLMPKQREPFLMMLATVDTHPPFTTAKDILKYKSGGSNMLNTFHTTDDGFSKFWDQFKASPYYENTILIAVADHAVFPVAYDKKGFPDEYGKRTFYDENLFLLYAPENVLPKEVKTLSSGIDFTPTILQMLGINKVPNAFEGHSIFDDRAKFPNILGMHEFGLYINQAISQNPTPIRGRAGHHTKEFGVVAGEGVERRTDYAVPSHLECADAEVGASSSTPLTLCEFLHFYKWKRQMMEEGRFWEK
ncbi:LTA synthase family protein [Patescibacteria group bacterium]|nr:MAG: LTA synthase family protein [Patescibacteria group bacterium]